LLLEKDHSQLPLTKQCKLLEIPRSTAYYQAVISEEDLMLMHKIDEVFTKRPFYGKRRMSVTLKNLGHNIGVKRTCTLMRRMGLIPFYPKPRTSIANAEHKIYPYLLRNVQVKNSNHVWSADITYIRLAQGFVYLVAVMDWFSRYVISWKLSLTLEKDFCMEALDEALKVNVPDIFNSDQGCQFTSHEFINILKEKDIQISMDGKGRCLDNIFVERLWRSVKYEEVYLKNYSSPLEAQQGLKEYFDFYNYERPHQSLNNTPPANTYFKQ